MSTSQPTSTLILPTAATALTTRFRQVLWPWIVYLGTFFVFALQLTSTETAASIVMYVRYVAAIAVALNLFVPRKPGRLAAQDVLVALLLLAVPVFFTQVLLMVRWTEGASAWLGAVYLATTLIPCIFCIALAALIAATAGGKSLQWPAAFLAPLLYPNWWMRGMVGFDNLAGIILYEGAGLLIAFPAAIAAWMLWKPQTESAEATFSRRLTGEILRKELRLQKNNILFTIATVLLGIIGLLSISLAAPSVASFNPEDIRDALSYILILPLLTLILPLMIGSTAAAGEKPMGVQAWQPALPISHWRVTLLKFTVITGLLFIISVVLPYLFAIFAPDLPSATFVFRHTSPLWLAFLCAAIGYYSGTLARDDYQGLLISIIPIALLILAMTYADPLRLVFPAFVGWQEPLSRQYVLAARLLIIAALFIFAATRLQRQQGIKFRSLAIHAAIIMIATFVLTLINVVGERTALSRPDYRQFSMLPGYAHMQGSIVHPQPIVSAARPMGGRAVYASVELDSERQFSTDIVTGTIHRSYGRMYGTVDTPSQPFIVMPGAKVREFPQAANAEITGISPGGTWILAHQRKTNQRLLCGPAGITIHTDLVPRALFEYLQQVTAIELSDEIKRVPKTLSAAFPGLSKAQGRDLLVKAETNGAILIKDGATLIPDHAQRWHRVELQNSGLVLHMLPQNDNTTSQVAVLEPLPEHGHYKIAGVANGDRVSVTSDGSWVKTQSNHEEIIIRKLAPPEQLTHPESVETQTSYTVSLFRPQANGTTITVSTDSSNLRVTRVGENSFLAFQYTVFGPVTIGNRVAEEDMWLGQGALILNLKTGAETLVPFNFPWSASTSAELLNNFREETTSIVSWRHTTFMAHPEGPIAASYANNIIVADPLFSKSDPPFIVYTTTVLPAVGVNSMAFLSRNEIIATDSQTLYHVTIPEVPGNTGAPTRAHPNTGT